ncbi:hypothetical protein Hdeb2414_s0001g00002561 [Helianthus debilis subsp. tardiflorus]
MLSLSEAISRSRVSIPPNRSFSLNPTEDPVGLTSRYRFKPYLKFFVCYLSMICLLFVSNRSFSFNPTEDPLGLTSWYRYKPSSPRSAGAYVNPHRLLFSGCRSESANFIPFSNLQRSRRTKG